MRKIILMALVATVCLGVIVPVASALVIPEDCLKELWGCIWYVMTQVFGQGDWPT